MNNFVYNINISSEFTVPEEIDHLVKEKKWEKLDHVLSSCLENLPINEEMTISSTEHLERIQSLKKAVKIIKTETSSLSNSPLTEHALQLLKPVIVT